MVKSMIRFSYLTSQDVVRHPLVQKIVKAYDAYEEKLKDQKKIPKIKKGIRAERIRSNRNETR